MSVRAIFISGLATAGKDYLCSYLISKFPFLVKRFALADELKADLNDFLKSKVGISALTINPEEKKVIRPMLVAYGAAKRMQTQGKYWTGLLQPKLEACISEGRIPIVTDVRYDVYPEDEVYWALTKNKGVLIHVSRINERGIPVAPPNADEATNDPKIEAKSTYKLICPTFKKPEEADFFYSGALQTLLRDLNEKYAGQ